LQPPYLIIQFIDSLRNIPPTDSDMHFFSPWFRIWLTICSQNYRQPTLYFDFINASFFVIMWSLLFN
jgi:hypothetical protein